MAELVRIVGANDITNGNGWWTGSTAPPAGSSLSRIIRARGRSYDMVVARQGQPLLDSELNLMQQIVGEKLDNFVQQLSLTGWTKAPGYPIKRTDGDLSAHATVRWNPGTNVLEFRDDAWLVAKGQFLHISNPDVDNGRFSSIDIGGNVPASNTVREDLLFVEFWYEEVGPDGLGETDSASRLIKKEGGAGNLDYPQADINESLVDPLLNIETTRRVQLRWRLRVAESTGSPSSGVITMFTSYPWGLTDSAGTPNPTITAMGATSAPVSGYYFQVVESPGGLRDSSLGPATGPAQLWRTALHTDARTSADALKTVDGYSYAVPMLKLIRDSGNGMHGEDLRLPSRMYIPDRSIHALQLAGSTDLDGAGVTGGLSAKGSVIEPESIKGGAGGDVGHHTIDSYNMIPGGIDEDDIGDTTINIQHIAPTVGLPTRKLQNMTGERVYNGSVVFVTGDTFNKSSATPSPLPVIGVVENYEPTDPAKNYIDVGELGWVRMGGLAGQVLTSGAATAFVTYTNPSATAGYYPAIEGTSNIFGQVLKTYAHSGSDPVGLNRADILMFAGNTPDQSIDGSKIKNQSITINQINPSLIDGLDDEPTLRRLGRAGTAHATDPYRAVPANDPRLNDTRGPTGSAGGDLTGTYPNPTIATGAVTAAKIANGVIADVHVHPNYVNGAASAPSLRSITPVNTVLGPSNYAAAADSPALTNSRPPTGPAGGVLSGTYPNPVFTPEIITFNELHDGSVTTPKIVNQNVTNAKLAPGAITEDKITDGNVTVNKIGNQAVTTAKIADNAVIDTKIGDEAIFNRHLSLGCVDQDNMNTDSVGILQIIDNSITTPKIQNGSVTRTKILSGEVQEYHLAPAAVTISKIANNSIDSARLVSGAVATSNIQNGAVDYTRIGVVPCLRLRRYATQTIPSTGLTPGDPGGVVLFQAADVDNMSSLGLAQWSSGAPGVITIRVSGIYFLSFSLAWIDIGNAGVTGSFREASIGISSTATEFVRNRLAAHSNNVYTVIQGCSTLFSLAAGTQIRCEARQNTGVNQGIGGDGSTGNELATTFSMLWVGAA